MCCCLYNIYEVFMALWLFVACYECITLSRNNYDSMSYLVFYCFLSLDFGEKFISPAPNELCYWAHLYCCHWFYVIVLCLPQFMISVFGSQKRKEENFTHLEDKGNYYVNTGQATEKKFEMTQFTVCL